MRAAAVFVGDATLQAGDVLLYDAPGPLAWWVRVKTWSDVSHVETYLGRGRVFAARRAGVRIFDLRVDGLRYVLRPVRVYDVKHAAEWRATVVGQAYDWCGLLVFYLAAARGSSRRMFCSEAVARDARAAGVEPFAVNFDADRISPGDFLKTPAYRIIYRPHEDLEPRRAAAS